MPPNMVRDPSRRCEQAGLGTIARQTHELPARDVVEADAVTQHHGCDVDVDLVHQPQVQELAADGR